MECRCSDRHPSSLLVERHIRGLALSNGRRSGAWLAGVRAFRFIAYIILLIWPVRRGAQWTMERMDPSRYCSHGHETSVKGLATRGGVVVVFADTAGTHIWQVDGGRWRRTATLSISSLVRPDALPVADRIFVLLFEGQKSTVIACTFDAEAMRDDATTDPLPIRLDEGVETATISLDGDGRLWVASDGGNVVNVRWADEPYLAFSKPYTLAAGITNDDIYSTSLPDGSVVALWSNQNKQRYGFRRHLAGTAATEWTDDEVPAGASAMNCKGGMSDDHLNVAVSS